MPAADNTELERLVDDVLASSKYRDIHPDLIRNIGMQELQKRRHFKDALKATKNKLHQVGGAYFHGHDELESARHFSRWLEELQTAIQTGDQAELRRASIQIMLNHASTRERIPILEQFYATLFADLPPIHSILDLACGLNPLSLPWMGVARDVEYYAYDIYEHMTNFLSQYMLCMGVRGHAQARNVLQSPPEHKVDVALLLKALPCLEQLDKQATYALLRAIDARYIIVSYPVHSLGGKGKGMITHYEAQFQSLLDLQMAPTGQRWQIQKYSFETELAFVLSAPRSLL